MHERATLQAFAARLQPYRESVQAAEDLLSDLSALHREGSVLPVQERVDLLRALVALAKVYEGCRAVVGATNDVPLALVPERLDLQNALCEAKEQALALARRLAALELPPPRRDLSDWWATEQAIGALRQANAAVAVEARHLVERARFLARADQAAPHHSQPSSRQSGKRDQQGNRTKNKR